VTTGLVHLRDEPGHRCLSGNGGSWCDEDHCGRCDTNVPISATATGDVPFNPASNRVFVSFTDAGGINQRGRDNVTLAFERPDSLMRRPSGRRFLYGHGQARTATYGRTETFVFKARAISSLYRRLKSAERQETTHSRHSAKISERQQCSDTGHSTGVKLARYPTPRQDTSITQEISC